MKRTEAINSDGKGLEKVAGGAEQTYTIDGKHCIECGCCKSVCPAEAITTGSPYKIDSSLCIRCGNCADACPVACIHFF